MNDCYFEKKDWRLCKEEVIDSMCLVTWFLRLIYRKLTQRNVSAYRWKHFVNVGRKGAMIAGLA